MKRALRLACLSLLLAAAAPATVLASQPKPPAGKKPAPAAAPAPAAKKPPADDDSTLLIVGGVVGGLIVLGGLGFGLSRVLSGGGKGDGRAPDPLLPERRYDWEVRMTDEQERAMLRGIEAYRDGGHSLLLGHSEALLTFYEPPMLVSLHQVTDAFLAGGPAAVAEPLGTMRAILDRYCAGESPGVLHLRKDWFAAPIDGLDNLQFTNLCYDTLTCPKPYVEGMQGSSSDEYKGCMTVGVEAGGPLNTFCVDLARVLLTVREARRTRPSDPLIELVRPVLQGMAKGELQGGMWTRGTATPAEVDLVVRAIATSQPRAS